MSHIKAQVEFAHTSGLPEDSSVATFHFSGPGTSPTLSECQAVAASVSAAFANLGNQAGATNLMAWLSPTMNRAVNPTVDVYGRSFADPNFGSPMYSTQFAGFTAVLAGAAAAPAEVALCMTYHADLTGLVEEFPAGAPGPSGDIHPRARARGRFYAGPFSVQALGSGGRPHSDLIRVLQEFGQYLITAPAIVAADVEWCVYSRTADVLSPVVGGWVDNEWDTQRRRGLVRTARNTFSSSTP